MEKVPALSEKPEEPTDAPAKKVPGSGVPLFGVLIMTLLAGALGGAFGLQMPSPSVLPAEHGPDASAKPVPPEMITVPLPPITTNLAGSSRVWVRLEATLAMKGKAGEDAAPLANKIGEDIVAFLRTVTPEQIEGASGFLHLREDLNERISIRSEGKVTELLIQTLIIE